MSEYGPNDAIRRWDGENWSLAVASVLGVRVRFHVSLLVTLFAIAVLAFWFELQGLVLASMLFLMLLLHEIGHCFVAQAVGARGEQIVLWPLGGLTAARVPNRVVETMLIQLAGPAANLLACLAILPWLQWMGALNRDLFHPFLVAGAWQGPFVVASYLALAFKASYWLLLANLVPLYPLDAGRMLRETIAMHAGMLRATLLTTLASALGALVAAGIALWYHYAWVALAAGFVAFVSFKKHREVEMLGDAHENEFGYDFSEGYTSLEKSMSHAGPRSSPSLSARVRGWIQQRKQKKTEILEVELDRILAKIHDEGMASLSRLERKTLAQASRKRRH